MRQMKRSNIALWIWPTLTPFFLVTAFLLGRAFSLKQKGTETGCLSRKGIVGVTRGNSGFVCPTP